MNVHWFYALYCPKSLKFQHINQCQGCTYNQGVTKLANDCTYFEAHGMTNINRVIKDGNEIYSSAPIKE